MFVNKIFLPSPCVSGNKQLAMKKLALLILVVTQLVACKKATDPPLARIVVGNLQFGVDPSVQPPYTYYLPINNVQLNALSQINAAGIDTSEISSIRPRTARLSALFGGGSLDFIDAVSIRLCPYGDNKENCGSEAFYRDPTPLGLGGELDLGPTNVDDLRDLVLQKQLNVQVKMERLRDAPQGSFTVVLEMEFGVY